MTWLDRLLIEETGAMVQELPPEEARALQEERAAILEHEAGMDRGEAERRAGMLGNIGIRPEKT